METVIDKISGKGTWERNPYVLAYDFEMVTDCHRLSKEKIARNAASTWCRCFKCDGELREMNSKCNKETLHTCPAWYNGYRTALLALDDDRLTKTE